ncbi:hypothetical protein [Paenibacillus tengchongensis]|uniref:hypothetical protein n=1 Tax=Paenibacillus tengchongensis TaxID=2608684 RepID=UPI00124C531E|nr:hypothetical protein [Paenibacillus tengchongensis]
MKHQKLFIVITLAAALLAGCQDAERPSPSATAEATATESIEVTPPPAATAEPTQAAAAEPEPPAAVDVELPELTYTEEQTTEILNAAGLAGLEQVYIPVLGLGTDDYLDRIEVQDDTVRIVFIRGAISQSKHELKPAGTAPSRSVRLSSGVTAEWIRQDGSSVEFLYFEQDGVHFAITSAKPFAPGEYEAAAGSLQPLKSSGLTQ